jgi:adenylate cyclase
MHTPVYSRKISAIMSADVAGYSRLMGDDEDATVRRLTAYRHVFSDLIGRHHGRIIDATGDNLLAEFSSVVNALRSAWDIQQQLELKNSQLPEDRRMNFRIGINLGDVIETDGALYGDGVNVAARLESLAEAGGISISGAAYDQVKNKLPYRFVYQGEERVKNISDPIRVYQVKMKRKFFPDSNKAVAPNSTAAGAIRLALWLAAGAILVVGLVIWGRMHIDSLQTEPPADEAARRLDEKASIAVLPLDNLSQDPEQVYFSDGITRDIITDLSKFRNLIVISSNTTFIYKNKPVTAQDIGIQLGVRYIAAGSVQKNGNNVRVNVELIDASTGTHVWAERYERGYNDIFSLQTDIVQAIVSSLAVKISKTEQARALRKQPENLAAYDYLLRGQEQYYRYKRDANLRAGEMYARAIELDPNYAAAYTGLGWVYQAKVAYGWTDFPDKSLASAFRYGRRALELDSSDASAHSLLCGVYAFQNQYERAIAEGEQATALNPNDAVSYLELGWALLWSGQVDEAIMALKKSLRLDSTSQGNGWWHLGMALYLKGKYLDAIKTLERGVTQKPGFAGYYIGLAAAYARLGRTADADRAVRQLLRLDPFFKVDAFGSGFRVAADRAAIREGLRMAGLK